MCGGGGSGGSGTQQYNWNDTLAPYWGQALSWGEALTDPSGFGAYHPYQNGDPNARIAGLNNDQQTAFQELRNMNGMTNSPMNAINGAINQTTQTENGGYLSGPNADPYANGAQSQNPWSQQMITNETNPYIGQSDQFNHVLQSGLEDLNNAYQNGTAADTTRMFNLSGAFGGSAHEHAVANNQNALARQQGNYISGMMNDQYNRSAGLAEGGLNRQQQTDMYNKGQGFQGYENMLNRGSQAYQNERGRMMQGIDLGNQQQGLGQQRANSLLGVGDANRSLTQDYLNLGYNNWNDNQNHQYQMLDYLTGLMGRAQGGVSPNMTSQQSGYSASPFSQILGAGLLGYGATR